MPKDVIKDIIEAMPYRMRKKAEQSYERYKAEKRETLSPKVVPVWGCVIADLGEALSKLK